MCNHALPDTPRAALVQSAMGCFMQLCWRQTTAQQHWLGTAGSAGLSRSAGVLAVLADTSGVGD
jgi:hypothetical protein